jgi:hypothetical protein
MESGMERVIECPEHAASIQARFHDDQSFLEMGRDYAEALDAWRRWQTSDGRRKLLASRTIETSPQRWRARLSPRWRLPRPDPKDDLI